MALETAQPAGGRGAWETIRTLLATDGSAVQPMAMTLQRPAVPLRDLADAVHALCMLHGRHPGVIDYARDGNAEPAAAAWLAEAGDGFAGERAYLAHLTAAVGPLPSTPGQADTDSAIVAQAHALDMLAQSDRTGCAIGAAIALVVDWASIRAVLDTAADRFGLDPADCRLPLAADTATLVSALGENGHVERAIAFGAEQVLAQHRGLWDLLAARTEARDAL